MINEIWKLMKRSTTPEVKDAAIITAIQHIHHYDIAGYGSLSAYAKSLGLYESAHILHDMLEEEKEIDISLKFMALENINMKANKEESIDEY
jgi:ferritin-like metal-binding protein YciE